MWRGASLCARQLTEQRELTRPDSMLCQCAGKHIFTDITGHRYTVVPGKTRDWDAHQRYMASRNKSST